MIDLSVGGVERGEQRGRAVPLVVMGHRPEAALFERQARLRAVERLDLRFLVEGQYHRVGRWIDVEPDDIPQLLGEMLVIGQLELPDAMRLEAVFAPDPLHRGDADADHLGQRIPIPSSPPSGAGTKR